MKNLQPSVLVDSVSECFMNGKLMKKVIKDGVEGPWREMAYREELRKIIAEGWMTQSGYDVDGAKKPIAQVAKERAIELMNIIGIK